MLFEDAVSTCPHCNESISVPIDPGGGETQDFYLDCEVCCRSILVHAKWSADTQEYDIHLDQG